MPGTVVGVMTSAGGMTLPELSLVTSVGVISVMEMLSDVAGAPPG